MSSCERVLDAARTRRMKIEAKAEKRPVKWLVVIRDITESSYEVEAVDAQEADYKANELFKADGGPQNDYQESSTRCLGS